MCIYCGKLTEVVNAKGEPVHAVCMVYEMIRTIDEALEEPPKKAGRGQ